MIFIERDAAIETAMFTLASKLVDFAKQSKRSFPKRRSRGVGPHLQLSPCR